LVTQGKAQGQSRKAQRKRRGGKHVIKRGAPGKKGIPIMNAPEKGKGGVAQKKRTRGA